MSDNEPDVTPFGNSGDDDTASGVSDLQRRRERRRLFRQEMGTTSLTAGIGKGTEILLTAGSGMVLHLAQQATLTLGEVAQQVGIAAVAAAVALGAAKGLGWVAGRLGGASTENSPTPLDDDAKARLDAMKRELDVQKQKLAKVDELERKLAEQGQRLDGHDQKFAAQGERLDGHDQKFAGHGQRLDDQDDRLAIHDRELTEVSDRVEGTERGVASAAARLDQGEGRLLDAESRLAGHDRSLTDAYSQLEDLVRFAQTTQSLMVRHNQKLEQLDAGMANQSGRLDQLTEQNSKRAAETVWLRDYTFGQDGALNQLGAENAARVEDVNGLRDHNQQQDVAMGNVANELRDQGKDIERISERQTEAEPDSARLSSLESSVRALLEQQETLRNQHQEMANANSALRQELGMVREELNTVNTEHENLLTESTVLKAENAAIMRENATIREQLGSRGDNSPVAEGSGPAAGPSRTEGADDVPPAEQPEQRTPTQQQTEEQQVEGQQAEEQPAGEQPVGEGQSARRGKAHLVVINVPEASDERTREALKGAPVLAEQSAKTARRAANPVGGVSDDNDVTYDAATHTGPDHDGPKR